MSFNPAADLVRASGDFRALKRQRSCLEPLQDVAPQVTPPQKPGVFQGLVIAVAHEEQQVEVISSNGGTAVHGVGANVAALMPLGTWPCGPWRLRSGKPDVCLCRGNGPVAFQCPVPLVTTQWLEACVAERCVYESSAWPQFELGSHAMPLPAMARCVVRITALSEDKKSTRERWRLEELVQLLGAKAATQETKKSEVTHLVCASERFNLYF